MKYCVSILVFLHVFSLNAQALLGNWEARTQDGNRIDYQLIHFFSETMAYVKGGVAFAYPEGYFSKEPSVCVTLASKNSVPSSWIEMSPIITDNTAESVSIFVHKTSMGLLKNTINEAETDDVIVHVLAFGP